MSLYKKYMSIFSKVFFVIFKIKTYCIILRMISYILKAVQGKKYSSPTFHPSFYPYYPDITGVNTLVFV